MLITIITVDPLTTTAKRAMIRGQSNKSLTHSMTIRFTYDIQTQQLVYAVCNTNGDCKYLTTSITDAIKLIQQN
jgi:hypothetical protein